MSQHNDNTPQEKPEFSRVVHVQDLTSQGCDLTVSARPEEMAALTARLGVDGVEEFSADAHLEILPGGDVRVDLTVTARIHQTCVVTLHPMMTDISSAITTTYSDVPEDSWGHDEEEFEDIDADIEPPEPLTDGQIDIGEAAVEQLALEIDPFPRVKGATFDGYSTDPEGAEHAESGKPNPFAVLAKLKSQPDKPD